ncbi:unnamed protein product [Candida verbasci]|uniref:Uncharacterized protein n=1 Tax=Candida verbasci TaxID=1227364 RepID=A0A9W4U023_9ASCO|nr:unnamed protein product [Candida verbasci]
MPSAESTTLKKAGKTITSLYGSDDGAMIGDQVYVQFTMGEIIAQFPNESAYSKKHALFNCTDLEGKTFTYSINGKEMTLPLKPFVLPDQKGEYCYHSEDNSTVNNLGA